MFTARYVLEMKGELGSMFVFKGRLMFYAVIIRYLTAETLVRSQPSPCEMCSKDVSLGQAFLRVLGPFFCQYNSTKAPYSAYFSGYPHNALTKSKNGLCLENLRKSDALSGNWGGGRFFTFYSSLKC